MCKKDLEKLIDRLEDHLNKQHNTVDCWIKHLDRELEFIDSTRFEKLHTETHDELERCKTELAELRRDSNNL